ncbi:NAC transcription factor 32 [Selaginella moellendorffii]|uniref:NAC transcription factor 32 n=1 Tax=Selaginella moellendorffii TaxID=88036 RepID=UPI000D1C9B23|nr:NAC transcription factor 32 [Selaginella moellendorffii]|eukprot:XP_024537209.1 NAC transcription factor 32 [Selaginella moellendorffii]
MRPSSDSCYFNLPGFRFNPTEEELVSFYLECKVRGKLNLPPGVILDVDFYHHDPWELSDMIPSENTKVFYFFVPRDRKYPDGSRPRRVARSGYWKATGTDHKVSDFRGKCIGKKKTLVFYQGRAPKGNKTNWVMNEFRLPWTDQPNSIAKEEFDVTLCRMYQKSSSSQLQTRFSTRSSKVCDLLLSAPSLEDEKSNSVPSPDDERSGESLLDSDAATGEISELLMDWSNVEQVLFPEFNLKVETHNLAPSSSAWPLEFSPGILVTPTSIAGHCLWENQS